MNRDTYKDELLGVSSEEKMDFSAPSVHEKNKANLDKYKLTAYVYDILDFPWELQYRHWRPGLVGDIRGEVIEAGVGTGRNLRYYSDEVNLTALDFSPSMLRRAMTRARSAACKVRFLCEDACHMVSVPTGHYDWVVATFLCCVIPPELQHLVVAEFSRILKPGGRFRLVEMIHSENSAIRARQDLFAPFVRRVYGAGFDRETLRHVQESVDLRVTATRFLKHDVYLLIEGIRQ